MVEEEMKTIHKTRGAIQKRAQDRKEWKDFIVAKSQEVRQAVNK